MKNLSDLLTIEEYAKFKAFPKMIYHLGHPIDTINVKQLCESANVIGTTPDQLLGRIIDELAK